MPGRGPLAGFTVIDISEGMAGGLTTMLLADYGADVIKIERPGGDPARRFAGHRAWDRGKRSIVLAAETAESTLRGLLARADVVVEASGWSGGEGPSINPVMFTRLPGLVRCQISGYGQEGPWRDRPAVDCLVAARLGMMAEAPGHRRGPIFPGFPMVTYGTALLATIGITAALHARETTGRGQLVDVSMFDGALALSCMTWWWSEQGIAVISRPRGGSGAVGGRGKQLGTNRLIVKVFQCGDGEYLTMHTGARGAFGRAMKLFGLDAQVSKSKGANEMAEPLTEAEAELIGRELPKVFLSRTRDEWLKLIWAEDIAAMPVLRPGEGLGDPQVEWNGVVATVDDPGLGLVRQVGPVVAFSATPPTVGGPAPSAGQDTADVLSWLSDAPPPVASATGELHHPMEGVRILDLGSFFAGPYASRLLAELGADVIKIEGIDGDPVRPIVEVLAAGNRGKRCLALDMKQAAGLKIFLELAATVDVVHHNLRPGVAERLGVDEASVRKVNPDVIYCYSPGYGSAGPKSTLQSFAPLLWGFGGLELQSAGERNPPLGALGNPVEDYFNALLAAAAINMALIHRRRSGVAQYLESPQLNSILFATTDVMVDGTNQVVSGFHLDGDQTGWDPLLRLYRTADGWICIAAIENTEFIKLCAAIGVPTLATDDRFSTAEQRAANSGALTDWLIEAFSRLSSEESFAQLDAAGVPCEVPRARAYSDELFDDPDAVAKGRVVESDHPLWGRIREIGQLIRLSDTPSVDRGPVSLLGQDTRSILGEIGYSDADIDRLGEDRCVAWATAR